MTIYKLSPILWTKDIRETKDFYEDVPGFEGRSHFPDFISLSRDGVEIMFVVPRPDPELGRNPDAMGELMPQPCLTGSIFFFMAGVDALWEAVKDHVNIRQSMANRAYRIRDFVIGDNNGYDLVFGQDTGG